MFQQHVHQPCTETKDKTISGTNPIRPANKPLCKEQSHWLLPALCAFILQSFNQHVIVMWNSSSPEELTKRDDDWASDAVGHDHGEDTHHPGVGGPKLELIGLVLWKHNDRTVKRILHCLRKINAKILTAEITIYYIFYDIKLCFLFFRSLIGLIMSTNNHSPMVYSSFLSKR